MGRKKKEMGEGRRGMKGRGREEYSINRRGEENRR